MNTENVAALIGGTDIPRRIAIRNGRIESAKMRDEEIHPLSRLGELVKASRGHVVYSRDHIELIDCCICTNDPEAWKAMCDDILCGCVPEGSIGTYFDARPESAVGLVRSLVDASDIVHSISIVQVLVVTLRESSKNVLDSISKGMEAPNGIKIVRLFATHSRTLPHPLRIDALRAIGELIPTIDVARGIVLKLVETETARKWDGADTDVVHVLGHSLHLALVDTSTKQALARILLEKIPKMPTVRRGPALVTLSRIVMWDASGTFDTDACTSLAVDALVSTKHVARAEEMTIRGASHLLHASSVPGGAVHVLSDRLMHMLDAR
jgi:hypothetical protein